MAKLISLPRPNGRHVWINPSHVIKLTKTAAGNTEIHLAGDDDRLVVDGDFDDVAAAINEADAAERS